MSASTMKVLVTGGTSGLGLAMASALAAAGATVALTGRSAARAAAAAAELPGATGIGLDVREESSVAQAVSQAWSRLGGIDMLVNNAGLGTGHRGPAARRCRGSWPPTCATPASPSTCSCPAARPPPACCRRVPCPPAGVPRARRDGPADRVAGLRRGGRRARRAHHRRRIRALAARQEGSG